MQLIIWIFCLVVVLVIVGSIARAIAPTVELPYTRAALFSTTEREFFTALLCATGTQYLIFPKMRLADIIKIRHGTSRQHHNPAFNRIKSKHIDFALANRETLELVCVIELDDASHQRTDRRRRDDFVDAALNAAGIKIKHFRAKRTYDANEIAKILFPEG